MAPRRKPDDEQRRSKATACLTVGEHEELRATMGRERLSVRDVLLMGLEALRARGNHREPPLAPPRPREVFYKGVVPFTERLR